MKLVFNILFLFIGLPLLCATRTDFALELKQTSEKFKLDGRLDEAQWQTAELATDFQMHFPFDSIAANGQTEVRVLYDEQYLYIGAVCHGHDNGKYVVQSLKRDFDFEHNDAFAFFINAFADGTSGYAFGVNAYGVQKDGIVPVGGVKGISNNWDSAWYSEVFRNEVSGIWSVEIAIPFKTLRFNSTSVWHINFARNNLEDNEMSTWVPVPRGINIAALSRLGNLIWDKPPPNSNSNVVIAPYAAFLVAEDYTDNSSVSHQPRIGTDAKIALSSSLNLDLTVNPDFSQAEVDQQVIDLSRFELSFPERRLFFLENNDLFSRIGNSRVSPFFSRRIGSSDNKPVPILFGARMSGKINNKWRVGLMDVHTKRVDGINLQAQNYGVAVAERSIFKGSSISAFLINRQAFDGAKINNNDFNRVGGIEFDYRSMDSRLTGKTFIHYAFTEEKLSNAANFSAKIRYKTAKFNLFLGIDSPDENFITDVGFVPRLYHENRLQDTVIRISYRQIRSNGYYRFFNKKDKNEIDFLGINYAGNLFVGKAFDYQEHDLRFGACLQMRNTSRLNFKWSNQSPVLFFPFQLDELDDFFLPGNYPGNYYQLDYNTSIYNRLYGVAVLQYGDEYLGKKWQFFGGMNYRYSHWGVLGFNFTRTELSRFPAEYGSALFNLAGSKVEISFSRKLFFTTFLQYNTQTNNFNINSRFQWRIKPMSDLYLVYTENYRADNIAIKDRALVLKMNYWIGL